MADIRMSPKDKIEMPSGHHSPEHARILEEVVTSLIQVNEGKTVTLYEAVEKTKKSYRIS